jgi:hypothetical protein
MAYFFPAPVSDQIDFFRRSVAGLKGGGSWTDAYFQDMVMALLAVEAAAVRDRVPAATVEAFRREAAEAMAPFATQLRNFVEMIADEAESVGEDDWEDLCGKRSAIEVLRTRYADSPATALINPADVDRLDEEMRRAGGEYGPVRPDFRMPGIPAGHAWWWYPGAPPAEAQPMSTFVDQALAMTEERLARTPAGNSVHNMFSSIKKQLEFMRDTILAGKKPTTEEKNRLTLDTIAVREFESTDEPYCDALTSAAYDFKRL